MTLSVCLYIGQPTESCDVISRWSRQVPVQPTRQCHVHNDVRQKLLHRYGDRLYFTWPRHLPNDGRSQVPANSAVQLKVA